MIATLADLWYVVSLTTGIVTLCMCEEDACSEAAAYDRLWPAAAPHIATRLHLVDAVRDGDRSEDLLEMVGA
jgi:hypothetical protein